MSSLYIKLEDFFNDEKNFYKLFFFLVVFLCVVKLPSLFSSDIQPWDEGMYATRVLSIHANGDFIDQSSHAVGKFYSASHPPLLIWLGYFVTLVFGINSITLKLIVFIFSILCILLILLIGKKLFSISTGFFAALIFCSNIIFTVFSQRFQLDIPYTFFILLSFYLMFLYNDSLKLKYLLLAGVSFGCCLMTKILVGFYIPIILFLSYFFIKGKVNYKFKNIVILTAIGVGIALPWHIYMIAAYGKEFTDYFFMFHIYDRALHGVEMNEKGSGILYHVNYFFSIIPYSILTFFAVIKNLKNYKTLNWQNIFLSVWFLAGLLIITLFKTKLEVYVLLILIPGCFLIPVYINQLDKENIIVKTLVAFFTLLNILWFAAEPIRPELKNLVRLSNSINLILCISAALFILFFLYKYLVKKIELKETYYIFILAFFLIINIYYLFFIPEWVNSYKLSEIKDYIKKSGKKKIVYISSDYRFNPQFSFYFNGLNLSWKNPEYEFELIDSIDAGSNFEKTKSKLNSYRQKDYYIILEKDKINRANDYYPHLFIPYYNSLVLKRTGYELYEKLQ